SIYSIAIMPGKNFDFRTANKGVRDPGWRMLLPLGLLALAAFLYGLYAEPLLRFFGEIAAGKI
ncbi:MAG: hypothetical protein IJU98_06190, partial [Synergistaceae bacterium]|nr:hypothetical protein [Synergistaceae bacterium]